MKDVIDYMTQKRIKKLWGQDEECSDHLIDHIHGDGKQLVYFQTMDSRPFGYLLRIDSGLDLDKKDHEILSDSEQGYFGSFSEFVMQTIEEECDNIDRYYETKDGKHTCDQDVEEGIEPFEYSFPMFSLGAGYSYSLVDQNEVRSIIKNNI